MSYYSGVLITVFRTKCTIQNFKQINNPEYQKFETICIMMIKNSRHDVIFKSLKSIQNLLVRLLIQKRYIWLAFKNQFLSTSQL